MRELINQLIGQSISQPSSRGGGREKERCCLRRDSSRQGSTKTHTSHPPLIRAIQPDRQTNRLTYSQKPPATSCPRRSLADPLHDVHFLRISSSPVIGVRRDMFMVLRDNISLHPVHCLIDFHLLHTRASRGGGVGGWMDGRVRSDRGISIDRIAAYPFTHLPPLSLHKLPHVFPPSLIPLILTHQSKLAAPILKYGNYTHAKLVRQATYPRAAVREKLTPPDDPWCVRAIFDSWVF
jgi:hypothetical protein